MSAFPRHTLDSAPEAAKPILRSALRGYAFVPNLYAAMAEAPSPLEEYTTLSDILAKADLSETERQIILMTNNRLNNCAYCMAAHTTLSQMGGVPDDVIEALRTDTPISDEKLEALRQVAIAINQQRGWLTPEQVNTVLAAGYRRQTLLEVILATALKTLSNYSNHLAETELDPALVANSWAPDTPQAAE